MEALNPSKSQWFSTICSLSTTHQIILHDFTSGGRKVAPHNTVPLGIVSASYASFFIFINGRFILKRIFAQNKMMLKWKYIIKLLSKQIINFKINLYLLIAFCVLYYKPLHRGEPLASYADELLWLSRWDHGLYNERALVQSPEDKNSYVLGQGTLSSFPGPSVRA